MAGIHSRDKASILDKKFSPISNGKKYLFPLQVENFPVLNSNTIKNYIIKALLHDKFQIANIEKWLLRLENTLAIIYIYKNLWDSQLSGNKNVILALPWEHFLCER